MNRKLYKDIQKAEATMRQREYNARFRSKGKELNIKGAFGERRYDYKSKDYKKGALSDQEARTYLKHLKADLEEGIGLFDYKKRGEQWSASPRPLRDVLQAEKEYEEKFNKTEKSKADKMEDIKTLAAQWRGDAKAKEKREKRIGFESERRSLDISKFRNVNSQANALMSLAKKKIGLDQYESARHYKQMYLIAVKERMDIFKEYSKKDYNESKFMALYNRLQRMSVEDFEVARLSGFLKDINDWYLVQQPKDFYRELSQSLEDSTQFVIYAKNRTGSKKLLNLQKDKMPSSLKKSLQMKQKTLKRYMR